MVKKSLIKGEPFVSIIIPMRKISDFVYEAMPYIQSLDYKNYEIIIVSEADETVSFPKTRILKVGKVSPAVKRNFGVANAKGEIVAFIDDDAFPRKDWLKNAATLFNDSNVCGVCGPGVCPESAGFLEKVFGMVYEIAGGQQGKERYKGVSYSKGVDDYPTFNLIVRKSNFDEAGGFDLKYWGGEDTQLCHTLTQKLKKKLIYSPDVFVYHHRRKDFKGHLRQSFFWGMFRGFFLKKFPETSWRINYLMPPLFVIWIIFGGVLSIFFYWIRMIYFVVLILYGFFMLIVGFKTKSIKYFFPVIFVTFLTQMSYGIGMLKGIFTNVGEVKSTFNPAELPGKKN